MVTGDSVGFQSDDTLALPELASKPGQTEATHCGGVDAAVQAVPDMCDADTTALPEHSSMPCQTEATLLFAPGEAASSGKCAATPTEVPNQPSHARPRWEDLADVVVDVDEHVTLGVEDFAEDADDDDDDDDDGFDAKGQSGGGETDESEHLQSLAARCKVSLPRRSDEETMRLRYEIVEYAVRHPECQDACKKLIRALCQPVATA